MLFRSSECFSSFKDSASFFTGAVGNDFTGVPGDRFRIGQDLKQSDGVVFVFQKISDDMTTAYSNLEYSKYLRKYTKNERNTEQRKIQHISGGKRISYCSAGGVGPGEKTICL